MNTFSSYFERMDKFKTYQENLSILIEALAEVGCTYVIFDHFNLLGRAPEGEWKVVCLTWESGYPFLSVRNFKEDDFYMDSHGECKASGKEFSTPYEGAFEVFCELT